MLLFGLITRDRVLLTRNMLYQYSFSRIDIEFEVTYFSIEVGLHNLCPLIQSL